MSKPDFVYVSYVRTTPARLWDALTSSDFSKRYWFGTELKSDFQVGSPFALVTNGTTTDVGEILKADRPRRLAYTFKHVLRENVRAEPVKPALVYTIYIKSTPEEVWHALTTGEMSAKYFFGNSVEVDQRVGGAYIVRTPDGGLHIWAR